MAKKQSDLGPFTTLTEDTTVGFLLWSYWTWAKRIRRDRREFARRQALAERLAWQE